MPFIHYRRALSKSWIERINYPFNIAIYFYHFILWTFVDYRKTWVKIGNTGKSFTVSNIFGQSGAKKTTLYTIIQDIPPLVVDFEIFHVSCLCLVVLSSPLPQCPILCNLYAGRSCSEAAALYVALPRIGHRWETQQAPFGERGKSAL